MSIQVGVSTLTFGIGYTGEKGPSRIAKFARKHGLGLQLDPLKGWNPLNLSVFEGLVLTTQRLPSYGPLSDLLQLRISREFIELYEALRSINPISPDIRYVLGNRYFVHMQPELFRSWGDVVCALETGRVGGIVVDTSHNLRKGQFGQKPLASSPQEVADQLSFLLENGVPTVFHLQPRRLPELGFPVLGPAVSTSDWSQLGAFIRGVKGNVLSTMIGPLKGHSNVPLIIELDPKVPFLVLRYLVRLTKNAIVRELS